MNINTFIGKADCLGKSIFYIKGVHRPSEMLFKFYLMNVSGLISPRKATQVTLDPTLLTTTTTKKNSSSIHS